MERIYLDANGSCPALPEAGNALSKAIALIGNPSSFHEHGRFMRMKIDESRQFIAAAIHARAKDLIFTSGASEANRLFVDSLKKMSQSLAKPLHVVMSPFEHPSLQKPIFEAQDVGLIDLTIMKVDGAGSVVCDEHELYACDVLIMCQAHNETGIMVPIDQALNFIKPETLVMSDISQSFMRSSPPSARIDVLTFSAQKMGGFAGVGGLVLRNNAKNLQPPWQGGGQERGFRPGTESTPLIVAFGEAARHADVVRTVYKKQFEWRDYFEAELKKRVPLKVIGEQCQRLPNTSAISFFKEEADALRIAMDLNGLSVGFGAACSGLAPEGSYALKAMGLSLQEEKTCVRFSFGPYTTYTDIIDTINRLSNTILTHKLHA